MARFEQYGRLDSPPVADGDGAFTGVNMLDDPATLPPTQVSEATNARFTTNEAAPRGGMAKLPWTNRVVAGDAPPQPFGGDVLAAEVFRDPNELEWTIIAAGGRVYRTRENNGATEIPLPPGTTLVAPITFTQTYAGFMMFRGEALTPLIMLDVETGFVPVAQIANLASTTVENPTDGTRVIPPANNGDWINNRLFIPTGDYLEVSDYLNPTRYAGVRAQARINEGSSDRLVRFFKFNEEQGIAFKGQSIYVVTGLRGALSDMSADELTRQYGLCAARSCVNVGRDVWFMAEKRGVCSVAMTDEGKTQAVDVPVSRALQPLIDRIDWRNAANSCAAFHDNKVYFAVPLDDSIGLAGNMIPADAVYDGSGEYLVLLATGVSYRWAKQSSTSGSYGGDEIDGSQDFETDAGAAIEDNYLTLTGTVGAAVTDTVQRIYEDVNNAVLVFDTMKRQWAGHDEAPGLMVQSWFTPQYDGRRRLGFVSADGFINLFEEGVYDEVAAETFTNIDLIGEVFSGSGASYVIDVTPGAVYRYTKAFNVAQLVNGADILTAANGEFTASSDTITAIHNTAFPANLVLGVVLVRGDWEITPTWVQQDVLTRGYTGAQPGDLSPRACELRNMVKRWQLATLALNTWFPQFSVLAQTDGVEEETAIAEDITRDRTRYYRPAFAAPFDETNVDDNHAAPYRQDYSVVLSEDTTPSGSIAAGVEYFVQTLSGAASITYNAIVRTAPALFTGVAGVTTYSVTSGSPGVYGPESYVYLGENGIDFERLQKMPVPVHLANSTVRGRYIQLRLLATQGLVRWAGVDLAGVMMGKPSYISG